MSIKKLLTLLLLIGLVAVLAACQSEAAAPAQPAETEANQAKQAEAAPTEPQELTELTVMLDWVPNTNHTGLFVAQEKGWYEETGLNVNIIQPGESTVEQVVGAGSADFGVSYQEAVTLARVEEIPIVSVAAVIQHNTSGFASRASAGIERPKDFEGKTYGGWGSPVEQAMLQLLMSCDGGDVSQVNLLDTGYADFLAVTQRDVDFAWVFYGWDGINAELQGVDLNVIMLNDWQECVPDYYTPVIVTNEELIQSNPDLVKDFVSATARGYEFAIANPDEAAETLLAAAPENDPELIKASQAWLSRQYQADAEQWGMQDEAVWQRYADWMFEEGLLPEQLTATDAYSNNFLPVKDN